MNNNKNITLQMSEKEFESLFNMAVENAQSISSSGDGNDNEFSRINRKRIKIINKMLKRNNISNTIRY